MKTRDIIFLFILILFFLPFFISPAVYRTYNAFNSSHGLIMSFFKFALLATLGEVIGLRIGKGVYTEKGFGYIPRAFVWGLLGMGIYGAMIIFSKGTPAFLESIGIQGASSAMQGPASLKKIGVAFSISLAMNTVFAPVFMTIHKITDAHIIKNEGSIRKFFRPIDMGASLKALNWDIQWNFVFKKTIPFFWIPAHTITFLLPETFRVLFAALLGIVLGVILAVAAIKSRR